MTSALRTPAVAGRFYPGRRDELLREVRKYTAPAEAPQAETLTAATEVARVPAIGCVAPHAGYMYSGHVAGAVYSRLEIPEHCVILCPNHTGRGEPLAVMATTTWQTPLGEVAASVELGSLLLRRFPLLVKTAQRTAANMRLKCSCHFCRRSRRNCISFRSRSARATFRRCAGSARLWRM